jgi:hypothetical protein
MVSTLEIGDTGLRSGVTVLAKIMTVVVRLRLGRGMPQRG